ncbi:histidine-rich glycoprotein-like isoform X2 [Plodia interpunctella]|uniref:histidine-rich glycoprotein-like isoform X2 n=1 Tax=Plodia interpunctella TaxID=58824 RepID=UPI002368C866|nr:histidine-rich glycoprotein-like isoform X2 [Plodia interpunctella]
MRPAVIWLSLLAIAVAEIAEEPWVEEEADEQYNEEVETHERSRREAYVEEPYEEHVRVKRRCYDEVVPDRHYRVRRSDEYARVPRQVHQYEVHEFTDDAYPSSLPYEEMLAASAEHYHRVYAVPGAPAPARYLSPDSTKGYKSDHHLDKGAKGHKTDEVHRKEYEEAAGKKHKHHDNAGHKGSHEEEAHGHRGSHFGEKKGHKKGHKTKGYHNKYHKDEFHKEHKFYDDFHKSGEHHRYGKFNAKHASNESGKKKAHHVNAGHDFVERGKKGYSNKGHLDEDHTGYKGGQGHEEHHAQHSQHGKKGGKEGGSQWGYEKKN